MLDNLIKAIPPVTRTITLLRVIGVILIYTKVINEFDIYFNTSKILQGEIWRIPASLFFFKDISFSVVYKSLIMLYVSTSIEKNGFKRGSIDYLYFSCLNFALIILLAVIFGISSLSGIYLYSLYYYFGRIYSERFIIINFIPIRAPYVLWFILAIEWIGGDPALYNNMLGLFVGHCMFFMFNIYQDLGMCRKKDRKLFDTPKRFVDLVSPLFSIRNRARDEFDQDDILG